MKMENRQREKPKLYTTEPPSSCGDDGSHKAIKTYA